MNTADNPVMATYLHLFAFCFFGKEWYPFIINSNENVILYVVAQGNRVCNRYTFLSPIFVEV